MCPILKKPTPLCRPGFTNTDINNCSTDTCISICPLIKCLKICKDGYEVDKDGCQTCECKSDPDCPEVECKTKCEYGYKVINKCPTCKCNDCPRILCDRICEHGFQEDKITGCPTCKCNEKPPKCDEDDWYKTKCPLKCDNFEKDKDGCPKCSCVDPPKPCECKKPAKYEPKKCLDDSHTYITDICKKDEKEEKECKGDEKECKKDEKDDKECHFVERKCPLCFSITFKNFNDDCIVKIKDLCRQNYNIHPDDVKHKEIGTSRGETKILVCIERDAVKVDIDPKDFASHFKSNEKDHIIESEFIAEPKNNGNIFIASITLLLVINLVLLEL
jgi:hypothetical protein